MKKFLLIFCITLSYQLSVCQPVNQKYLLLTTKNSLLQSNVINDIKFDNENTAWIGTNSGLSVVRDKSWLNINQSNSNIPHNTVTHIAIKEDKMWFAFMETCGILVDVCNLENGVWTCYNKTNSWLSAIFTQDLVINNNYEPLVGTDAGLFRIHNKIVTVYQKAISVCLIIQ